jgi:hypothetical protein
LGWKASISLDKGVKCEYDVIENQNWSE